MPLETFSVILNADELEFARQLVNSKLAVAMDAVEVAHGFKRAILMAKPMPPLPSTPPVPAPDAAPK